MPPRSYPADLRARVLAEVRRSSQSQAARENGLSRQTIIRWMRTSPQELSAPPAGQPGGEGGEGAPVEDEAALAAQRRLEVAALALSASERVIRGIDAQAAAILARDTLTAKDLRDLAVAAAVLADKSLALSGKPRPERFGVGRGGPRRTSREVLEVAELLQLPEPGPEQPD